MTLFDYMNAHPYVSVILALIMVAAAQAFAKWQPIAVTHNHAAPEAERVEEGGEEEDESDDAPAVDVSADPRGEVRYTEAIRALLSTGDRVTVTPADIAPEIADKFRSEGWRVRIEPNPVTPFATLAVHCPERARLTFTWGGVEASS